MNKYINTIRSTNDAEYARVEPSFDGALLAFQAKTTKPTIAGTVVPMIKGFARLIVPAEVDVCDTTCKGLVNESVKIEFNIKRGNTASLAALRAEVDRVLTVAITDYQLANGIVPPVTSAFAQA